jgi:natural product precursor
MKSKKLEKIKLNRLSKDELDRRSMNSLKGGSNCKTCPFLSGPGYYWDSANH